jgi:hypothetical protein
VRLGELGRGEGERGLRGPQRATGRLTLATVRHAAGVSCDRSERGRTRAGEGERG